jgi:hypothetical protein
VAVVGDLGEVLAALESVSDSAQLAAALAASHDYKARVPLSLSRLCTANTPSVLIYFVTLSRPPPLPRPLDSVQGPNAPALTSSQTTWDRTRSYLDPYC